MHVVCCVCVWLCVCICSRSSSRWQSVLHGAACCKQQQQLRMAECRIAHSTLSCGVICYFFPSLLFLLSDDDTFDAKIAKFCTICVCVSVPRFYCQRLCCTHHSYMIQQTLTNQHTIGCAEDIQHIESDFVFHLIVLCGISACM